MKEPNAMSFHVKYKPEDFMPANEEEKQSQVIMRESVGFWQDGFRRLRKNKVAMVSLFVIIVVMIFSFIVPAFYPYDYKTQIKGSENLHPMQYSEKEIERMDAGEKVFPLSLIHIYRRSTWKGDPGFERKSHGGSDCYCEGQRDRQMHKRYCGSAFRSQHRTVRSRGTQGR